MSIKRVTPETVIEPGQYVCFESVMIGGLCTPPRRVTRVAGQRLYVMDRHDETEKFKSRKTAVFVGTKDDGDAAYEISKRFMVERFDRINSVEAAIQFERDAALAALIAASNTVQEPA